MKKSKNGQALLWIGLGLLVGCTHITMSDAHPTPAPASSVTSGPSSTEEYPGCGGLLEWIGDGVCDSDTESIEANLNNEECGYDGGDCCECECEDAEYTCGSGGFECLDPSADRSCEAYPTCGGIVEWIGDGICDSDPENIEGNLNNEECGYDGGDCCECECENAEYTCGDAGYECVDPSADRSCEESTECGGNFEWIGDGFCDSETESIEANLNNEECGYDGGDCCECECEDDEYTCGDAGYECLDPSADRSCEVLQYPECGGLLEWIGDGFCDSDPDSIDGNLNNEECGYDGGDCCRCTCEDADYTCGVNGYECLDPSAGNDCPTPSPAIVYAATPSPIAEYPGCGGNLEWFSDGYCDSDTESIDGNLNTEECGYDGGDCCECECEDDENICGVNGYVCLDPSADRSCEAYPTCEGNVGWIGDGYCDSDPESIEGNLNTEECGYDGGDCCECDCQNDAENTCGVAGYVCLDPSADRSCEAYPGCGGNVGWIGDGYCDDDKENIDDNLNTEECGYDGGDCCECECQDAEYECGFVGYVCVNPDADRSCEAPTAPAPVPVAPAPVPVAPAPVPVAPAPVPVAPAPVPVAPAPVPVAPAPVPVAPAPVPVAPAPVPVAPAPVPVAQPPEEGVCSDGTPGIDGNGVVCCPLGCGKCGGSGCGTAGFDAGLDANDCCGGNIKSSGVYCDITGEAPCIIGTPPEVITGPGTCSDGTPGVDGNGVVCCSLGCSQCGGSECGTAGIDAGLDASDCCGGVIKGSGVYCGTTGKAPCIIGSNPAIGVDVCSDGVTTGIDGNQKVCCPLACGMCGGSGCGAAGTAAGLGSGACCGGAIMDSEIYCDDTMTAPCIIGSAP